MESITDQILRYKRTGAGLETIVNRIGLYVYYRYPSRKSLTEDERSDFFLYFFPKIPSLIERFVYTGKPFDAYLNTSLKWQLKTFRAGRFQREKRYRCVGRSLFWYSAEEGDPFTAFGEQPFPRPAAPVPFDRGRALENADIPWRIRRAFRIGKDGLIHDPPCQRRLLLLILKSAYQIEPEQVEILAVIGGFEPELILSLVDCLRARVFRREPRFRELDVRRNLALSRLFRAEESLFRAADPRERERLSDLIADSRSRLSGYLKELRNLITCPTNREVAELLGIPKGTVDSALYNVKKALEPGIENKKKRTA